MKKFEGMLFCTDLDGTLYNDEKTVSKQNLDAIEYFKSEGGLFTFITGRVPATSKNICNTIHPNAPYITVSNNRHAISAIIEGLDTGAYLLKSDI